MAAYRWVYDSRHLQADCQAPGSAPEPYARQSSMGYLFLPVSHYLDEAEERLQFAVRASVRPLTAECVAGGASAGQSAARAHVAGRG